MSSKTFKSTINVTKPVTQEIHINHRYDKEWKTNFVTLNVTEMAPDRERPISDEVILCFNTPAEFKTFIEHLNQLAKKMK